MCPSGDCHIHRPGCTTRRRDGQDTVEQAGQFLGRGRSQQLPASQRPPLPGGAAEPGRHSREAAVQGRHPGADCRLVPVLWQHGLASAPGDIGPHLAAPVISGHTGTDRQAPDHQQAAPVATRRIVDHPRAGRTPAVLHNDPHHQRMPGRGCQVRPGSAQLPTAVAADQARQSSGSASSSSWTPEAGCAGLRGCQCLAERDGFGMVRPAGEELAFEGAQFADDPC